MNIGTLSFELYSTSLQENYFEILDIWLLEQYNQSQFTLHTLERHLSINNKKLQLTYPINLAQSYTLRINPLENTNCAVIENLIFTNKENVIKHLFVEKSYYKVSSPMEMIDSIPGEKLDENSICLSGNTIRKHLFYNLAKKTRAENIIKNYEFSFKI